MKYCLFDTETTGLPKDRYIPAISRPGNWPDIVSISWMVFEEQRLVSSHSYIIEPRNWTVPKESTAIHGITDSSARRNGIALDFALEHLYTDLSECDVIVAHNLDFDKNVVDAAWVWHVCPQKGISRKTPFGWPTIEICTADSGKEMCRIPFADNPNRFRFPKLTELYQHLLKRPVPYQAHSSLHDTLALADIFFSCDFSKWSLTGSRRKEPKGDAIGAGAPKGTILLTLSEGNV